MLLVGGFPPVVDGVGPLRFDSVRQHIYGGYSDQDVAVERCRTVRRETVIRARVRSTEQTETVLAYTRRRSTEAAGKALHLFRWTDGFGDGAESLRLTYLGKRR